MLYLFCFSFFGNNKKKLLSDHTFFHLPAPLTAAEQRSVTHSPHDRHHQQYCCYTVITIAILIIMKMTSEKRETRILALNLRLMCTFICLNAYRYVAFYVCSCERDDASRWGFPWIIEYHLIVFHICTSICTSASNGLLRKIKSVYGIIDMKILFAIAIAMIWYSKSTTFNSPCHFAVVRFINLLISLLLT